MHPIDRRSFVGTSLTGLAGLWAAPSYGAGPAETLPAPRQFGETLPAPREASRKHDHPLGPDTLFLTWRTDPTTTMTVQWIAPAVRHGDIDLHVGLKGTEDWRNSRP